MSFQNWLKSRWTPLWFFALPGLATFRAVRVGRVNMMHLRCVVLWLVSLVMLSGTLVPVGWQALADRREREDAVLLKLESQDFSKQRLCWPVTSTSASWLSFLDVTVDCTLLPSRGRIATEPGAYELALLQELPYLRHLRLMGYRITLRTAVALQRLKSVRIVEFDAPFVDEDAVEFLLHKSDVYQVCLHQFDSKGCQFATVTATRSSWRYVRHKVDWYVKPASSVATLGRYFELLDYKLPDDTPQGAK